MEKLILKCDLQIIMIEAAPFAILFSSDSIILLCTSPYSFKTKSNK